MESPGVLLLYGVVKLLAYTSWSWLALHLAGVPPRIGRAVLMGGVRWGLGLVLGVILFFAVDTTQAQALSRYIAVYVPVRIVEWFLLSVWVLPAGARWSLRPRLLWLAGGVVLSFLTDLVSPDMVGEGRFCIGRCLC
jgi:hypothetical protein